MDNLMEIMEIGAANRYYAYLRGWDDGSRAQAKREDGVNHSTLSEMYLIGYEAGYMARQISREYAMKLTGYEPSILRIQHESKER